MACGLRGRCAVRELRSTVGASVHYGLSTLGALRGSAALFGRYGMLPVGTAVMVAVLAYTDHLTAGCYTPEVVVAQLRTALAGTQVEIVNAADPEPLPVA